MGHRGHVANPGDLHAHVLQGANRGITARAGAGDDHVELADPVLAGSAGRLFGGHLGGVRSRLAGALESDCTTRGPHDGIAALIGDGDEGVVERRLDMGLAM